MKTSRMVVALAAACVFISVDAAAQSPPSDLREESVEQHLERIREGMAQMWAFECPLEIGPIGIGREKGHVLRPGESFTYEGVSITWEAPPEGTEATESVGTLTFEGPTSRIANVEIPLRIELTEEGEPIARMEPPYLPIVYLDNVVCLSEGLMTLEFTDYRRQVIQPSMRDQPAVPVKLLLEQGLSFEVRHQPSRIVFPAHPSDYCTLFVSAVTPLFLNEWRLIPSEEARRDEGNEVDWKLLADNLITGEELSMPLASRAKQKIGRFEIHVGRFDKRTTTALLWLNAHADRSVKGRYAYISKLRLPAKPLDSMLDVLGKECGFEVEWAPLNPKYPRSLETIRAAECPETAVRECYVDDLFTGLTRHRYYPWSQLGAEWKDDTHVVVRPKDHDEVIAGIEREERRKKESEEFAAIFESEYSLSTEAYRPEKIKASTAKDIVTRELRVYCLDCSGNVPDGTHSPTVEEIWQGIMGEHLGAIGSDFSVERQGEFCMILACPRLESLLIEAQRERLSNFFSGVDQLEKETVLADDMSNSLIVNAIPKTHGRIQELLAKMEGLLGEGTAPGRVDRYRLEVVLLSGGQAGMVEGRSEIPLFFRMDGIVEDVLVEDGRKVESGDVVATLASDEFELTLKEVKAEIEGLEAQHAPLTDAYQHTKQLFEHGHAPMNELKKAEVALASWEAKMKRARIQLEKAERNLEKSALRAPDDGIMVRIAVRPGQKVEAGETVARLRAGGDAGASEDPRASVADSHPLMTQRAKEAKQLMERYGMSAEDLEMFGLDTVEQIGRGIVTLAGERGEAGRVKVSLTENYGCELEFQDVREPYVIVRGRLLSEDRESPLLENTLYLEKDKPSFLGVTNLREALILVVRLHDVI